MLGMEILIIIGLILLLLVLWIISVQRKFAVMDGKPAQEPHSCAARSQGSHPRRPSSRTDGGWTRGDLNADPTDRLRGDGRDAQPRRRSDYRRDRYDR